MTLTEFLLARIAEDENVAKGAQADRRADVARGSFLPGHEPDDPDLGFYWTSDLWGGAQVVVGAERVLAECAAKRRVVELHYPLDGGDPDTYPFTDDRGHTYWPECAECAEKHVDGRGCATLRALALPCVDHPDYRDEWCDNPRRGTAAR